MYFEDIIFTEELRISSSEKALDELFKRYLKEVFSAAYLNKINRRINTTIKLRNFRERTNVMAYAQGTKIFINKPLFDTVPKDRGVDYIMHEMFHVLSNTGKFPEIVKVNNELVSVVANAVPRDKVSDFFTGKHQNIYSNWKGEALSYLCNNSINWDIAVPGTKLAYKNILEESGIFNMESNFWKKRIGKSIDK